MAYFTPFVDSAGMHIPTYIDLRDSLIEDAKNIFGSDIYIDIDSADYQFISACSLKMYDVLSAIQLAYNNRGPQTASGAGLDVVVGMNGLARLSESYSTCLLEISGISGATINNGSVSDTNGNTWNLPALVTIGPSGQSIVSSTCASVGNILASAGSINIINTPTEGWTSVINTTDAVAGRPAETDSQLRSRQSISVALPSQTLLEGTIAALFAIDNVSRVKVYENDTNKTSPQGFPPHSITAVVEGGNDDNIAHSLLAHKGIGGYTNGTTSVLVYDIYDQPNMIRFYRPTYIPIFCTINIKRLAGWSPAMTTQIKSAVATYLNSLNIGDYVVMSSIWGAVLASSVGEIKNPAFSITQITAGRFVNAQQPTDVSMLFYEAAQGLENRVTINLT